MKYCLSIIVYLVIGNALLPSAATAMPNGIAIISSNIQLIHACHRGVRKGHIHKRYKCKKLQVQRKRSSQRAHCHRHFEDHAGTQHSHLWARCRAVATTSIYGPVSPHGGP